MVANYKNPRFQLVEEVNGRPVTVTLEIDCEQIRRALKRDMTMFGQKVEPGSAMEMAVIRGCVGACIDILVDAEPVDTRVEQAAA
jgi:hypothetical protein